MSNLQDRLDTYRNKPFKHRDSIAHCTWWKKTGVSKVRLTCEATVKEGACCPATKTTLHSKEYSFTLSEFTDEPWSVKSTVDARCDCGYEFGPFDKTLMTQYEWQCEETGELTFKLPIGALYVQSTDKTPSRFRGYDGLSVVCVTPGGHWPIDTRASNCTKPADMEHKCWVRHGTFGEPVTVDKNGNTCAAGAGSIIMGDFHGFVHDHELRKL